MLKSDVDAMAYISHFALHPQVAMSSRVTEVTSLIWYVVRHAQQAMLTYIHFKLRKFILVHKTIVWTKLRIRILTLSQHYCHRL